MTDARTASPGLRERKRRATRRAILLATLDLIERKSAGQADLIESPSSVEDNQVVDLMAALEASVAAAKAARQSRSA